MIDLDEAEKLFNQLGRGLTTKRELKTREAGLALCAENKKLRELVGAQKEYIKLLGRELEQTASIAFTHGWRSMEFGRGEELRTKIAEIEELLK